MENKINDLIRYVVESFAGKKDVIEYKFEEKDNAIEVTVLLDPDDMGKVIGKQGKMLKQIGSYARESIEKMLQSKVYLALWVKIKEDWRNSDFMLREIGYDKKEL